MAIGAKTPLYVQGEEEVMEAEVALDFNVSTPGSEAAIAVSSATATLTSIYTSGEFPYAYSNAYLLNCDEHLPCLSSPCANLQCN